MTINAKTLSRWTAALIAVLVAAGTAADATSPVDASQRTTIQPGAGVHDPYIDRLCTLGFLLKDASGAVYAVTGADCARDEGPPPGVSYYEPFYGTRTWAPGKGPTAVRYERRGRPFGHYVAQVITNNSQQTFVTSNGWPLNYAILRLDRGIRYSGTVAVVGGPRRKPYTGRTSTPTTLTFVCLDSYPVNYNDAHPAYDNGVNQSIAPLGLGSPTFEQISVANGTCQGAPVLDAEGTAVAVYGAAGYRLDAIIAAAQKLLHLSLRLVGAGESGVTAS